MKILKTLKKSQPITQCLMAFGLFLVAVLMTRSMTVPDWEVNLFKFMYGLPHIFHAFFYVITQFGSIYMLIALVVVYLLQKKYHIVLRLFMTGALAYLLAGIAKDTLGRVRPYDYLNDIMTIEVSRGSGFPSGHMALAAALALTMWHYLPKKYHWLVYFLIIGVGLSRLVLGVHFPMDLVGGFAIGWGSYALFRLVKIYDARSLKK